MDSLTQRLIEHNVFETHLFVLYINSSSFRCGYTKYSTVYPFFYWWTSCCSQFRAFGINMLWPILQKSFGEDTFSFLWSNYIGLELLSRCVFFIIIGKHQTFIQTCTIFLPHWKYENSSWSTFSTNNIIHLCGFSYIIEYVVLFHSIFKFEQFLWAYWLFVYLLWRMFKLLPILCGIAGISLTKL